MNDKVIKNMRKGLPDLLKKHAPKRINIEKTIEVMIEASKNINAMHKKGELE